MVRGAGVDYGTAKIAVSMPSSGVFDEVVLRPGDNLAALDVLAETCCNALILGRAEHVSIESPIVGMSRNLRVGISLGMVAGALVVAAREAGATVELVPPASWKKAVVGFGNANKDHVRDWLRSAHPDHFDRCHGSQDLIDATCLGLYAEGRLGR